MSNHSDEKSGRRWTAGEGSCEETVIDDLAVTRVREALSDPGPLKAGARVFSAFADPTRLRILHALELESLCVCDLAAITGVSQSGVSHQLRVLRDLNIVTFERAGKRAVYSLADDHVRALLKQMSEHVREDWADSGKRET